MNAFQGVSTVPYVNNVDLRGNLIKIPLIQSGAKQLLGNLDNIILTSNPMLGTLRGLHFQIEPFAERKIVFCVQGAIFDVIVDLRENSESQGDWTSIVLNSESKVGLSIPSGFAHGYLTLEPNTEIIYLINEKFSSEHSFVLDYKEASLGIDWPLNITKLSDRDSKGLSLTDALELNVKKNSARKSPTKTQI